MDAETIDLLILHVRGYSELYDMGNKNYSNQNRREIIWSEIGKKINESGDACKKKWKSIRDSFQRAAKYNQTKSGQAAKGSKKWKYWDAMSFLLPHIKGRETHTNLSQEEIEHDEDGEDLTQIEDETIDTHSPSEDNNLEDIFYENLTSPLSSPSQPNTPLSCSSSMVNTSTPVSRAASAKSVPLPKKTKAVSRKAESLPEILKEYVNDKKRCRLEKQTLAAAAKPTDDKNSALLEFFATMAKTTATFPPLWQAKVKNGVFAIVNSYELALLENSSAPVPPPVSTESQTYAQQQPPIHTKQMHNLAMQNQPPIQIQAASMLNKPSVPNQPSTLSSPSFFYNEASGTQHQTDFTY